MASYLVTGATGFIGRHLTELLLARGGEVHALVRPSSRDRLDALAEQWGAEDRVFPLIGDLDEPLLGVGPERLPELIGRVDHFFHLAALYDMSADAHRLETANVKGTWHAVQLADAIQAGCFQHVSSIAAAGRYPGVFTEEMFHEATRLDDPYFRTKHAAEAIVRSECRVPWRIYRPGVVVGHSETGEMDKVDGPYLFFGLLERLAAALPSSLPLIGIEGGGEMNIVPVDFVAAAMDHIAHREGLDGRTFHLVDPNPKTTLETINLFARIAGAPRLTVQVGGGLGNGLTSALGGPIGSLALRVAGAALESRFGIPPRLVRNLDWPTHFDCRATETALSGSDIAVPPLETYAPQLWSFWETELDADLRFRPALARVTRGRRVMITGASAGIGRAAALKLGAAGARVVLVARSRERLERLRQLIERAGGEAWVYPTNLASMEECDLLAKRVIDELGGIDVLVNNAGRSIRRSIDAEYERFHDFERTMQLNYFGAVKLTLAFLPGMRERRDGHIVNVSSMGVQAGGTKFSAYVASKAAFDAFSRAAAGELVGDGVAVTTLYMPLVRTAMSKPTRIYDLVPALTSAQAAEWICRAIVQRPRRMALPGSVLTEAAYLVAPGLTDSGMNVLYQASSTEASDASAWQTAARATRGLRRRMAAPLRRLLPSGTPRARSSTRRPERPERPH